MQLNKEMTLASNRSLAEGNLLYQPRLDARKASLTQKYQELQALFEAYQIKKTKLGTLPRARSGAGWGGAHACTVPRPREETVSRETSAPRGRRREEIVDTQDWAASFCLPAARGRPGQLPDRDAQQAVYPAPLGPEFVLTSSVGCFL